MSNIPSIKELRGLYKDRPVAVIGGGPSAIGDFKKIPDNAVIISTNNHAWALGLEPDYMVFIDDPKYVHTIWKRAHDPGNTIRITSQVDWSDFEMDVIWWAGGDSGMKACWLGCFITEGPVILCGIDCFQGENRYFHSDVEDETPFPRDDSIKYIRKWNIANHPVQGCYKPERIYSSSGLLTKVFETWK